MTKCPCGRPSRARGLCNTCYVRKYRDKRKAAENSRKYRQRLKALRSARFVILKPKPRVIDGLPNCPLALAYRWRG